MTRWTRRDLLKTGLAATAGAVGSRLLPPAQAQAMAGAQASSSPQASASAAPSLGRERLLLDYGWKFVLGNANDPVKDTGFGQMRRGNLTYAKATGLAAPSRANYNDTAWRSLDLPHDWAVELPFQNDPPLPDHGGKPLGREYPETSIGWYRRTFDLAANDAGRRIAVEFDGVFRNATVFFNGQYIGQYFSGYAPFRCDLTDFAVPGPNALAVRVDATLGEGWFYEGAGIYRHVWLVKSDPLHVAPGGLVVRSTVSNGAAALTLLAETVNESDLDRTCSAEWRIFDGQQRQVATVTAAAQRLAPWSTHTFEAGARLDRPALWSLETPNLYRIELKLLDGVEPVDQDQTGFGVRTIRFDPERGFFLNERAVKIKGTCNHHDHAGVGTAVPDAIQYYRVGRLKAMGSNGCRTSHNPPTPAFLDACDALGMVVMCETRMMSSTPEGLSQLERMVRAHRNHPSVILWSMGNEEPQQGSATGARVATAMKRLVRQLDPTRPVTQAMNGGWEQNANGAAARLGVSGVVDVQGFNYGEDNIDKYHADFPHTSMIGSETASAVATRGVYAADKEHGYVSAYDTNVPGSYAKTAEAWWKFYAVRPFLAGGFAWTGFDYRGEPSPSQWPCISSHFGILDTCGFAKDTFYYYQAWWGGRPALHLFPHWNWTGKEGQPIAVWCFTNLDSVELLVNRTSLGSKTVEANGHLEWQVPYAAGAIEARGSKGGRVVLTERRETAGAPAKLALWVDRTAMQGDGQDVVVITAEVQDAQGRLAPLAANKVQFALSGPGTILGVGNGDPACHEADRADIRSAFNGLCMALVQSKAAPGEIRVEASAVGLTGDALVVTVRPATPPAAVPPAAPIPAGRGRGGE